MSTLAPSQRQNPRDCSRGFRFSCSLSPEQQARIPTDPLGGGPQLLQRPVLDLADALLADPEQVADLAQAVGAVAGQAETQVEHLALPRPQVLHQEVQGFLTF